MYVECGVCGEKYPYTCYDSAEGCDADIRIDEHGRPYICTGFYGAYDFGDPIYFIDVYTIDELKEICTLHERDMICDTCLHNFDYRDRLVMENSDGEWVFLREIS